MERSANATIEIDPQSIDTLCLARVVVFMFHMYDADCFIKRYAAGPRSNGKLTRRWVTLGCRPC